MAPTKSKWTADDERRVSNMLAFARAELLDLHKGKKPSGPQIVFRTLQEAVHIHRRMMVKVGPAKYRSAWMEYIHDAEEKADAAKQRMIDLVAGDLVDAPLPSAKEISAMESVYTVFRDCLVDRYKDRDWKLLHVLSSPSATLRRVGQYAGKSKDWVVDRRDLQCAAIWKSVQRLMPPEIEVGAVLWEAA